MRQTQVKRAAAPGGGAQAATLHGRRNAAFPLRQRKSDNGVTPRPTPVCDARPFWRSAL